MKAHKLRRGTVLLAVVILAASVLINNVLSGMKEPPREEPPSSNVVPVKVIEVKNDTHFAKVDINGRLFSQSRFEVFTEVTGRLMPTGKPFKDGVAFNKGEILLHLDDTDARYNLLSTRSAFQSLLTGLLPEIKIDFESNFEAWKSYLANFDPTKSIGELPNPSSEVEKNFLVSRNVYDRFYTIQSMEAQLRKYTVIAPFDGIVSNANVNPNTILRAGQRVGDFIDPINFEMEAGVPVDEIDKFSKGDKVVLQSDNGLKTYEGKVVRKSENVDPQTQNIKTYIEISGKSLYEGVYLNGYIQGNPVYNSFRIPRYLSFDKDQVYVVEDGRLRRQQIDILHENKDHFIISGIDDGTQLVNQLVPGAHEDMAVEVKHNEQR